MRKTKCILIKVYKNNVQQTVEDIRQRSAIISSLEKEGKVKVVGYSLTDGKVRIIHDDIKGSS